MSKFQVDHLLIKQGKQFTQGELKSCLIVTAEEMCPKKISSRLLSFRQEQLLEKLMILGATSTIN